MAHFPALFTKRLEQKKEDHLYRELIPKSGLDFSSNDYLGFAQDPELRSRIFSGTLNHLAVGSTASRLLRGHDELFERAEEDLARFCSGGSQEPLSALIYASGYQCNMGVVSAVAGPGDLVFSDALNHASLIDGIRLSGAKKLIYPHLDVTSLKESLNDYRSFPGLKFIITESLFSMNGDLAPLTELAALAKEYGAYLIVDEAHATGLWGLHGGGIIEEYGLRDQVFCSLHTGGKAFGVGGAWVCGPPELKNYLVNFSRPFIFSTAPPPLIALSFREAVRRWGEVGYARALEVRAKSLAFQSLLAPALGLGPEDLLQGPIVPIVIGDNYGALQLARTLRSQGFDVRAIRPPTVPIGSARVRVVLHWHNSDEDIERLARVLAHDLGKEMGEMPEKLSVRVAELEKGLIASSIDSAHALEGVRMVATQSRPGLTLAGLTLGKSVGNRFSAESGIGSGPGIFVTGTDTGVGKTVVSSILLKTLREQGIAANYFKPIQTGHEKDRDEVARLSGFPLSKIPPSVYEFPEPMAPGRAAELNGTRIELSEIQKAFGALSTGTYWIVEGCGGILVPINEEQSVRDLVSALELPLLIVASTRLGTINHTLLTVEAAKSAGVRILGIALVGEDDRGLKAVLERQASVPVIAQIPDLTPLAEGLSRIENAEKSSSRAGS